MQNMQDFKKWSALRGIAVVTLTSGKKIGSCDDFYFEPQTHSIYALRVKTGLLSHKIVLVAGINAIGQDAITIPNEDSLRSDSDDPRLTTLLSGEELMKARVMSAGGTLVGTIGTALLDISTPTALHVAAFELSGGLREQLSGKHPTFAAAEVTSYGLDVLVIPDNVAQALRAGPQSH